MQEARTWDEPHEERGEALRELVDHRIATGSGGGLVSDASSSFGRRLFSLRFAGPVGLACLALFVGAFRGSLLLAPAASSVLSPSAPSSEVTLGESPPPSCPLEPPTSGEPEALIDVRDLPNAPRPTGLHSPSSKKPNAIDTSLESLESLEIETKILREARAARLAGAASRSLSLTAEHEARFPNGALAPERDAERISALCALGQREEARRRLANFERRWASSSLLDRVRTSCGHTP
ncbi:hypothetical protein [Labilithrix luteola]|uniref:hypothetical protein n=1 Tax=Labilithrix luteola TaxID=1391654 RepID=UPI0011BAD558|nr:hypothetical protein [Labilithrix luteola]